MGRLIAVGDIHGHCDRLERLLDRIEPTAEDRLVFLGDYIDRGPDSFGVVERLIDLQDECPRTVTLRGNHEDYVISLFLGNINDYERSLWQRHNGGNLTIESYRRAGEFMAIHQDFYLALPHTFETDDYFFCHAGVRPGRPLDQQRLTDLVDIRETFLDSAVDFGKIIVHGHSRDREVQFRKNRIGIDTGCGHGGPLTAIELPSRRLWQS